MVRTAVGRLRLALFRFHNWEALPSVFVAVRKQNDQHMKENEYVRDYTNR